MAIFARLSLIVGPSMKKDKFEDKILDFFDRPILGLLVVLGLGFIVSGFSDFFMVGIYIIFGICAIIVAIYKKIK